MNFINKSMNVKIKCFRFCNKNIKELKFKLKSSKDKNNIKKNDDKDFNDGKFDNPNFLNPTEQLLDSLIINNQYKHGYTNSNFDEKKKEWKKLSDQNEPPWYYKRFKLISFTIFLISGFYINSMEMDYFSNKYINVNKLKYLII